MLTSSASRACLGLAVIFCAQAPFAAADGWRPGGFDNLPRFDGVRDVVIRQLDLAPVESYGNWDVLAEDVLVCASATQALVSDLALGVLHTGHVSPQRRETLFLPWRPEIQTPPQMMHLVSGTY